MHIPSSFASLSTGVLITSVILNVFLGYIVFRSNLKSATNRLFALLTVSISAWMAVFFVSIQPFEPSVSVQWIRWSLFLTAPVNTIFLFLSYTFPEEKLGNKKSTFWILLLLTGIVALVTISPYTFTSVSLINNFPVPQPGIGLLFFALFVFSTNAATIYEMFKRYRESNGELRTQIGYLLLGTVLFLFLMFGTVLVPTLAFQNVSTVPLAPLYTLIFIATTTYASFRHHLFNVKVIATQAFVAILCIVFFARIFTALTAADQVIDFVIFIATLGFGVLLVRSVKEEVRAREKIQGLAKNLSETNWELAKKNEQLRIIDQRKSEFVSIVSHQLRTPITAIKGYASLLIEGTFGAIAETQKGALDKIFVSSNRLAEMVSDFLDISKIEQGTMAYTFKQVDFGKMVGDLLEEFQARAKDKKLNLEFKKDASDPLMVIADEGKVRQIVSNVIDNSIKYTPSGSVTVSMERDQERGMVLCKIIDTGVGLSQDDLHHLFGKFTRGSEGSKMNTGGSGLGLYVAKKMLEAHKGNIWVDSEGINKGSTFVITLPTDSSPNAPHPGTVTASTTEEGK